MRRGHDGKSRLRMRAARFSPSTRVARYDRCQQVDASRIDPRHTYAIGARIEAGSRLLWINTEQIRLRLDGGDELRVRVDQVGG